MIITKEFLDNAFSFDSIKKDEYIYKENGVTAEQVFKRKINDKRLDINATNDS